MKKSSMAPSDSPTDGRLLGFSPFALADAKRKRFLLGTGVVQFIFGGFLLLPVLFVLSLSVPVLVILLVWLTATGLVGMTISRCIPPTSDSVIDPVTLDRKPPKLPANSLFKLYITLQTIALLLGVCTLIIGAAIVHERPFTLFREDTVPLYEDLTPSDRVLFGTATIVLGAWLATVEMIMVIMGVHIVRKHYNAISQAIRRGQPVINIEKCSDVLKRPDQFEEDFFPLKPLAHGHGGLTTSLLAVEAGCDDAEEDLELKPPSRGRPAD